MKQKGIRCGLRRAVAVTAAFAICATQAGFLQIAQALGTPDANSTVFSTLVNEVKTNIAPGIQEKHITYINGAGDRTEMFAVDVDLNNSSTAIYAGTPNDGSAYAMQTVRNQAAAATKNGKQVVAAVNGDYYNMATGEPLGMELKDGVEIKDNPSWNFFGIKKDGTAIIGDGALYEQVKGDLTQALGGPKILVQNGQQMEYSDDIYPCEAVGIRKDNSVFFLTVDGKQAPYSNGITLKDLAKALADMGAWQALMLDGGGSATYVSKTPGDDGLTVKNKPSDGEERVVANSWLICTKEPVTHQFASAYLAPYDKTYTPGASVQFSAKGVDPAGYSASLPSDGLTWSLSDDTFGMIDAQTGLFQSSGKTGQFEVRLSYNGKEVGSTWTEIAVPDSLQFMQPELSLKFNIQQSLGLQARYQGRDVNLHAGDINWAFDPTMGAMDDQNIFHSGNVTSSGTMTAEFTGTSLSASLSLKVGQLPVVLYDFENGITGWSPSTAGRGEVSEISLSTYPNSPVRFGNNSLKLDYDFTNGQKGTTLGVYAGPSTSQDIPGMPTAIGAWVYATPAAQGYWLRMYLYDAKGVMKPIDFTTQTTGINWTGWRYVEAAIPSSYQGPYKTFPNQMVRIMCLKSGLAGGGPMTKGTLYIDNVRAVYGANVDDLYPPIIDSCSVDGKSYTSSNVDITATIHDDKSDPYMSGINWDRGKILVDGKDYSTDKDHFSYDKDGYIHLSGLKWSDGVHKATVDIQDVFGNETSRDYYFTVKTGNGTGLAFRPMGSRAALGGTFQFELTADNLANVSGVDATVNIGAGFPVQSVSFAPSAAGSTYQYDASTGSLTLSLQNSGADAVAGTLATVNVSVPAATASGSGIAYSMASASATFVQNGNLVGSISCQPGSVAVDAALAVIPGQMVAGADGVLTVLNSNNGSPAQGATVTMTVAGNTQTLGTTDADGRLQSPLPTQAAQKFTLQAQLGDVYSFNTAAQSFNPQKTAAPVNLMAGATQDPATQKTITWMTNPLQGRDSAILQVAKQTDYDASGDAAFTKSFNGTRQLVTYSADSAAVMLSSVTATGLAPGTAYAYRVGDGENWSDVRGFTTLTPDSDHLTFDVFGDTQVTSASGLSDFSSLINGIENSANKPDFIMHMGDFTDDQTVFSEMDITQQMFNQHPWFDSLDAIHVLGNHEHMGDDGSKSAAILGTPNLNGPDADKTDTYSVDYGNLHIVSLGWTDNVDEMNQKMDWLRKDMQATRKTWKIIVTHQPTFNKNPADGSTMFYDILPKVCDELGVDLVFSGHDHTYGRTYPIYNYAPATDDPTNCNKGTVYIAAGHTGDKTYDMLPAQPWAFAVTQSQDNKDDKVYLSCTVSGNKMRIVVKDSQNGLTSDDITLTAHAPDKTALASAVTDAQAKASAAQVGQNEGDYTQSDLDAFRTAVGAAAVVSQNPDATPEQVDSALAALTTAVKAFESTAVTVDRSRLSPLVAAAAALDFARYTPASWQPFGAALSAAQQVLAGKPTQNDIDQAFINLFTAENALVFSADKNALQLAVDTVAATDTSHSKPAEVRALTDSVAAASDVLADPNATQADVNAATASVLTALNNLQDIADRSNLQALIDAVGTLDSSKYTAASWQQLSAALTAAKATAADLDNYAADISAAYGSLAQAVNGLVLRANKASLSNTIGLAQQITANMDKYAPATVSGLQELLSKAQAISAQDDATQAQVDEASTALLKAVAAARIRADLTTLTKLVSEQQAIDLSGYTPASVEVFRQALVKAQAALTDPNVTQADVDALTTTLKNASKQLVALQTGVSGNGADGAESSGNPYTGGTTPVVPLLILLGAAGALSLAIVYRRRKM